MAKKPKPIAAAPAPVARLPLDITLGGRVFSVPPLAIGINREAYPLCAQLTRGGLLERINNDGSIEITADEFDSLAELAFLGVRATGETVTREQFDEMPISPTELLEAFFVMRVQTGGWVLPPAV